MISFHVVSTAGGVFERTLETESVVIGRSSSVDLSVPDPSMSRRHARLKRTGDEWFIEDLGSRNGTMINGQRVVGARLVVPGDVLTVGSSQITVRRLNSASPAPAAPAAAPAHTLFRPVSEMLGDVAPTPFPDRVEGDVRRYAERLHLLTAVHQALGRSISLDELLELILDRAFDHLRPEDGAIFLRTGDDRYVCAARRSARRGDVEPPVMSMHLVQEVAEKGQAALVLDTATDSRFNRAASLVAAGVRSLVAAPLLDPQGSLGMIVLGSSLGVRQFTEEDMELLVALASVAAMRIRNVRLAEEAAERRRFEEELALARRIQQALLSDRLPEIPGWSFHAAATPSRGVSGDMYRVIERRGGEECVILVADVSGKGIAASLLTASLEALTAGPIEAGLGPAEVLGATSRLLYERTPPEKYATAFLAVLEPASGTLTWANAGHNPAFIVHAEGSVDSLDATGMPIGLIPGGAYTAGRTQLTSGDWLVVYTDGITEAEDPDQEEYGGERLKAVCRAHRNDDAAGLGEAIDSALLAFARGVPFADDRTLVVVKRTG
jgi:sigma-B regulation protein RsbU (phosphoserine phosphatase)